MILGDPVCVSTDDVVKTPVEVKTSAPTHKLPKKGVPGFTSAFAIAGLLAALYLVLRRRG
ncbi:hypothetical protein DRN77_04835 [Methanosarcinales archaeon]|nr:MAG: hypothetical protein DRN77_04835 [Methanosarcinales archaeon]